MLKKRLFGMLTLIIGLMLVFTFAGCDNDSNPPPNQPADDPQTLTYVVAPYEYH
jgi:hypothetical protein